MSSNSKPLGTQAPNGSFLEKLFGGIARGLEKVVVPLNKATHTVSIITLFLMMFLTFLDVIGRNINNPITGTFELTGFGQVMLVFLSLGMTQIYKEHISIDIIVEKFPFRIKHFVEAFVHLIVAAVLFVAFVEMVQYTGRTMRSGEVTVDLGIPMFYFTAVAAAGLFVFALSIILDMFQSLAKAVQKHES